jgi:hypothetical protein
VTLRSLNATSEEATHPRLPKAAPLSTSRLLVGLRYHIAAFSRMDDLDKNLDKLEFRVAGRLALFDLGPGAISAPDVFPMPGSSAYRT